VHGIVHGALCADSVWLDEDDRPRLTDIGIAAHLDRQRLRQACPVRYWPPERMAALLTAGAPLPTSGAAAAFSAPADVWALGATLYELYAGGDVPFSAYVDDAVLTKLVLHQRGTLERPPDCPGGDWDCVRPCFAFLPQDRCSALAVLAEYERLGRTSAP
jgi:serine/threonine protein kinase